MSDTFTVSPFGEAASSPAQKSEMSSKERDSLISSLVSAHRGNRDQNCVKNRNAACEKKCPSHVGGVAVLWLLFTLR